MTNSSVRASLFALIGISLLCAGCSPETSPTAPTEAPPATTASGADTSVAASPAASASPDPLTSTEPVGPPVPSSPTAPVTGPQPFKSSGKTRQTKSGIEIDDMTVGTGPAPKKGQYVKVHYIGKLKDGTEFDASFKRNQPFEFQIGVGQVIPGWDEGVMTMRVGGRSKLMIPAALGYGSQGAPPVIPPNSDLIFDVELLGVSDTPTM